ncbi:MAG: 16S rRNA (cytidine(1402)-2'-O)-methyltransferase [Candidatus Yanofskybacteria bacterium RIFCSPHIGHO2_01_FULL_45_42]|uniref:Ribosomal RNA small subunit methyltransferase I n=3 Tax=Candidatus Yanofskyibacteriota TaxID=1752733 RepID=A0A1F8H2V3_9BACT|nr:MAG: 16S rRNA (cytidine(1402)-2'-O)-methyltransferase [Candidatus Yanofskybacteria bacterium RIFCSPHIGHO2_01_FULL_45_42]OGN15522.1 MAG: 16S rRNA (cytidine(1402)-2'-O)-methyltransferase [Candidatus Yanofskybacteria bacterium RIFCSPHIGHO2_02_FULL_46_19]OGN26285.1 MAG: 16S rRNA (cytidine(1402)-2'-O)-methyltransferase [Candidatus Yanofskybacteria bacterium RIFCSPLOWO2_01_FULL_45_72]OGN31891.1 MAG: 16S rRNA (cytidine(1402)-2'-O)-methyltransferase [Candidatus Yanofskybacteria bacterium RIFCSPLOWO2_
MVSTPIGNLEDITLRAITVLGNVDLILAEDTRVTKILLDRYNIKKGLVSYHQHSTLNKIERVIDELRKGKDIALVSDAGTPGINDPGGFLVRKILEALPDVKIIPIPGANAAIAALSISGVPADEFLYLGFPPHKKGRKKFFEQISQAKQTIVFYESKYRILKALKELKDIAKIGERPLIVARELTKQFETIYRGTADEILMHLGRGNVLGEFVVVVSPKYKVKSEKPDE